MISAIFVDRPRLAIVISILITLAGAIALLAIPVAQFPDIVPPQVSVSTSYGGANAEVVEQTVAQVIEREMIGVSRMLYMRSISGNDGSYGLSVSFDVGSDPEANTVNVQNRVQRAMSRLPAEVQQGGVKVETASSAILQVVTLQSPNGTYDGLFLSNYVTINVRDALARLPGVGQVSPFGTQDYAMRIWLDLQRLTGFGLTPQDVINAVRAQNVQAAVGRIGGAPVIDAQQQSMSLTTQGRLTTPEEFGNIIVRAGTAGSLVRVSDVARVELGAQSSDVFGRFNGKDAATLAIYLAPGGNAVATAAAVRATMTELAQRFPQDVTWEIPYDTTIFVKATIEKVVQTLFEAFALVAVVVFVFLGRLKATLVPIIAVPVALIGTFALMLAMGMSANTISLLALVLAIGIVVDDAIVVVEAVEHTIEERPDLSPADATKLAMTQITGPIIAITLVLLSVFVPVAFIPGIVGLLYKQFAIAVSISMMISAINALTLSPALCAMVLSHGAPQGRVIRRDAGRHHAHAGRLCQRRRTPGAAPAVDGDRDRPVRGSNRLVEPCSAVRLPARRRSGRPADRGTPAGRRIDQPHIGSRTGGGADRSRHARRRDHHIDRRLQHAGRHRTEQQCAVLRQPEAVRRAHHTRDERLGRSRPSQRGVPNACRRPS